MGSMETIAAGRIAFWEGGSVWVFDVPAGLDAPARNETHAHHAFQLTFSLGGVFNLHLDDRVVAGPSAIIAPDTPHAFEAQGLVSLLFIEPEGRAGRALRQLMQGQSAAAISAEQARDAPDLIERAFYESRRLAPPNARGAGCSPAQRRRRSKGGGYGATP